MAICMQCLHFSVFRKRQLVRNVFEQCYGCMADNDFNCPEISSSLSTVNSTSSLGNSASLILNSLSFCNLTQIVACALHSAHLQRYSAVGWCLCFIYKYIREDIEHQRLFKVSDASSDCEWMSIECTINGHHAYINCTLLLTCQRPFSI